MILTTEKNPKNRIKIYAVMISIIAAIMLAALLVLCHHDGLDAKLLSKFGFSDGYHPTNWAVISWDNTLAKMDYDADIVFFGDSITRGSDFRPYFPNKKIVNLGFSGDTILGMTDRVSTVCSLHPEKVFIMGGINSLSDYNKDRILEQYTRLLDKFRKELPDVQIFVQSILPLSPEKETHYCHNQTIRQFNASLKKICQTKDITFIDLYPLYEKDGVLEQSATLDGVHLKTEAYDRWAEQIRSYTE